MAVLSYWEPVFEEDINPVVRREILAKIWNFFRDSDYGEYVEFESAEHFRIVGNVYNRDGYVNGSRIRTSPVQRLSRAQRGELIASVYDFVFSTENTNYNIARCDMCPEVADECRVLANTRVSER